VLVGGGLSCYEFESGSAVELPEQMTGFGDLSAVAVSPDGQFVVAGTAAGPMLVLDDLTGAMLVLRGTDPVTALGWRHDGSELCVARGDTIEFWDVPDQAMLTSVRVPDYPVWQLAASPDGQLLATASPSGVYLIRVGATNDRAVTGERSGAAPAAVRFSRDGRQLLIGVRGGDVTFVDRDLRETATMPADIAYPGALDISRYGLLAIRTSSVGIGIYELPDTAAGHSRAAAADRRWAARHGRTVGRRVPVLAGQGSGPARATVLFADRAGPPAPTFAWWPDGWTACVTTGPGTLARIQPSAVQPLWEWTCPDGVITEVSVSASDLAAATHQDQVTVLDSDGQVIASFAGGGRPAWGPEALLAVAEPGATPRQILLWRPREPGQAPQRLPMPDGVADVSWSPDGAVLAAAGRGHVVLWNAQTSRRDLEPLRAGLADRLTGPLAWSADGQRLAAVVRKDQSSVIVVWNPRNWAVVQEVPVGAHRAGPPIGWSPDGRILAFAASGAAGDHIERCDMVMQQRLPALGQQGPGRITRLAWSPDGDSLAVTYADGPVILWDIARLDPPNAGRPTELRFDRDILVRLTSTATAAGAAVPLSLLSGLLALLGGDPPEELLALAAHRGVALLRGLRWPLEARIGLATLLAVDLPRSPAYVAPPDATRDDLAMAVRRTLSGQGCPVSRVPVPIVELAGLLDRVDDRLLTFLDLLGPEAVAAEPGLPARLRHLRDELTPLTISQRRLLGMRVPLSGEGRSEGGIGGHGRAGVARHGKIDALLLTQLALPPLAFAIRHSRDELLYRTRGGSPPPGPRAAVLVLDDTAAAHGQVGVTLRLIAHLLATVMIRKGHRCALVTLGEPATDVILSRPEDLIRIWTAATDTPPDTDAGARLAGSLISRLSTGKSGDTRMIVLTHPYQPALPYPGCITVRVYYPGRPVATDDPLSVVLPPDPTAAELSGTVARLVS
jgi:WD40 repeat protein